MERLRYLRLTGRQRVGIWLTLLVLALLAAAVSLLWHLKPVMTSMATARVSNLVNRIVSAAVNEAVENGDIDYQNFVIFEKDETGHITALRSNVAEVNRMQGQITDEILHRLSEVATSELEIPLGTLTGSALLAGRGPSLFGGGQRQCRVPQPVHRRRHQPDPAPDLSGRGCVYEHPPAGNENLHQGVQRDRRGGDGDRGRRAGYLHLFQHHA